MDDSTNELYSLRSSARLLQFLTPNDLVFSTTQSSHLFRGRPQGLFPSNFLLRAFLVIRSSILATCPAHLSLADFVASCLDVLGQVSQPFMTMSNCQLIESEFCFKGHKRAELSFSFIKSLASHINSTLFHFRKIADFVQTISCSDYFNQSVDIVSSSSSKKPIKKIVCFGIGKIRHCIASRYQLAYILALRRHFQVKSIEFHEPLLSQHDEDLLNSLNCELVSINIEGKLEIDSSGTTLVFLPHCPKQLINNLLWKNWSAAALRQIILISNSFQAIVQQTPASCLGQDAGYISQIERYTTEFTLRNSFEHKNVFNDLAIHFFNADNYDTDFFDLRQEPSYDTSELIETIDRLTIR